MSEPDSTEPRWEQGPFMRAARGQAADVVPVWLMRQAGRYMPEYRAIRQKVSFLELCRDPDLCAEVMLLAVEQLGVDAAILFSDLLLILQAMGLPLEFNAGEGPQLSRPVVTAADVDALTELEDLGPLEYVLEAVRRTRAGLSEAIPLIGFAGAPFTLASYAIEGGGSRNYQQTKLLMYRDPGAWHELMGRLARSVARYLNAQVAAGCQAVQLFDSWVGCLGVDDYRQYVLPHSREIIRAITPGVPVIHFGTGNPALVPAMSEAGGHVMGLDWRLRLDDAWRMVGTGQGIQGNLDPAVLLADHQEIRRRANEILAQAGGRPGHIFNLGHGVLPETPVAHARALVDIVHQLSAAGDA